MEIRRNSGLHFFCVFLSWWHFLFLWNSSTNKQLHDSTNTQLHKFPYQRSIFIVCHYVDVVLILHTRLYFPLACIN